MGDTRREILQNERSSRRGGFALQAIMEKSIKIRMKAFAFLSDTSGASQVWTKSMQMWLKAWRAPWKTETQTIHILAPGDKSRFHLSDCAWQGFRVAYHSWFCWKHSILRRFATILLFRIFFRYNIFKKSTSHLFVSLQKQVLSRNIL